MQKGKVDELDVSKDNDISMQWETGTSQVHAYTSKTCSFDMKACYRAKVLPTIKSVSKSTGYTTGG